MKYILFFLISFSAFSAETKTPKSAPSYPTSEDMRCEKLNGYSLSEFKNKLVENCDLNKPFTSSLSNILNSETYFYCCQIKK